LAQSMPSKKGCIFTSLASCSPEPRRALGSRTSRCDSRFFAFCARQGEREGERGRDWG
jgi:hypothetical protein